MRLRAAASITVLAVLASACVGHYRYESRGSVVTAPSGAPSEALLYWYGDEGRLWYGKAYKQTDSGVVLRVCGTTPKSFVPAGEGDEGLQLPSRSGDRQVARVDGSGEVIPLNEPKPLRPNSSCGRIAVAGAGVLADDLVDGVEPQVIILCDNQRTPGRYPEPRRYLFEAVTKIEVSGNEAPAGC